jgi:hypothetical protein
MLRTSLLIICFSAIAAAQGPPAPPAPPGGSGERVTVPLSSPGQPATVKARLIQGSITVTTGSNNQVIVETGSTSRREERDQRDRNIPPGMHRIDAGARGFNVEEDHNVVNIIPDFGGNMNLTITVPVNTSLDLKTVNGGHLDVTGVNGDINVENINGGITLRNVSGAVVANSQNGSLTVNLDRVTPDKPMSFSSLNGRVDVTLPGDAKAKLRLKTTNGAVYSDFDVKMEPDSSKPVIEDGRGQGGRYRIRMDRGVYGSINGGGPEYSFQTMNGSILIHKK